MGDREACHLGSDGDCTTIPAGASGSGTMGENVRLQGAQLRAPRRPRRRFAARHKVEYMRDVARRLGVEPPSAIWAADVDDAIRRLERNLTHQRQPSLFGEGEQ